MNDQAEDGERLQGVAIIGMAGRFPNAKDIDEFWHNLVEGVDCITYYSDEELIEAGIDPQVLKHPDYVRAKGGVADVDLFDAAFFGINMREAELTDPQHRMLLECAWEALEHAGYESGKFDGSIGVYGGKSMDYYLLLNVYPRIKREISAGSLQAAIGNDKDSLTTTISYRLNLKGPAITIQTSSSTSLVAVCVACQSLLTYQCDLALAGGITAGPPIKSGYLYQEGNIWSPDGHCRAFDAGARGFVPGAGMGLVVLRRLEDAAADGDTVWAVIKGFAVNNDGSQKVSYHAPSVDAQAEVVAEALAVADVHPDTIQYIETHGTATNLGDPIEMTALTQAFRAYTDKKQYCAVGSVKSNIGHLDNAAGVVGLIKVALSLWHRQIPASLHYEKPNPEIDFAGSPFFVNAELREWLSNGTPRRAGLTSLGMGGTNAHVIVEEAPQLEPSGESRPLQLLLLSARTPSALERRTGDLLEHLTSPDGVNLADAAYTLALGRRDFGHRRAVLAQDVGEAVSRLKESTPGWVFDGLCESGNRPVVFMFSGQGAQYVNMGKGLYVQEAVFREHIDRCADMLMPHLELDLRELIYPRRQQDAPKSADRLQETWLTQPALFALEYALARLWMDWGVEPAGMIGHSIGEYTAACLAGCMSLEDALELVALRGRLMQRCEKGAMLSVGMGEAELTGLLDDGLSLAAENSPNHCVVSGRLEAIDRLAEELKARNIHCRRLHTSHAFHSALMEPVVGDFAGVAARVTLKAPRLPFISCVTGTWIGAEEAREPRYWARQLRQPVRFSTGIKEILKSPPRILLEVGPANSLCLLAQQHKKDQPGGEAIFSSIRHVKQSESDTAFLLKTLAKLWLSGVDIDWQGYYKGEKRHRLPLPGYPFERERYWLEEVKMGDIGPVEEPTAEGEEAAARDTAGAAPPQREPTKKFQPRPELKNEYVPPATPTETEIAAIWEDILGMKPIGVEDNFFDLGGHSLLATLFLSHLQETFNVRLEMRTIFESPTISTIARLVESESAKPADAKEIENIIQEIEGLSEAEIQAALAEES
jgi:phthiocerol/phenolphthiocerol synthesis type-I polyketide synthase E